MSLLYLLLAVITVRYQIFRAVPEITSRMAFGVGIAGCVALLLPRLAGMPRPEEQRHPRGARLAHWVALCALLISVMAYLHGEWRRRSRFAVEAGAASAETTVLITLDTTRADVLGCYGGLLPSPSPTLDRLAAGGVRFSNVFAQVPITLPSHLSIMSGLYPFHHGLNRNGEQLPRRSGWLLAQRFQAAGWCTGAFAAAFPLDARFGLDQGFDHYLAGEDNIGFGWQLWARHICVLNLYARRVLRWGAVPAVPANLPVSRALDWLRHQGDAPVFLWLHLYDPHEPLRPPPSFRGRFRATAEEQARVERFGSAGKLRDMHGRRVGNLKISRYRDEVAYADAQIGRFLEGLEAMGRMERACICFTADHGEALAEHGLYGHARRVYQPCVEVPLVFHAPRLLPAGETRAELTQLIDVAPTLLALSGISATAADGRDLFAEIPAPSLEFAYSESRDSPNSREHLYALRTQRWSYWRDESGSNESLFDRRSDPGEEHDLLRAGVPDSLQALVERARDRITLLLQTDPRAAGSSEQLDPETRARLQALGYL
jgi:arylsulfatase A-like enzyme